MKSIVTIIFCSILSSLLAVGAYRFIEVKYLTDNKNDKNYAKHTSLNDYLFNGKLQRSFLSSAPTNFISAAQATTPAVVNIRSGIGASNFWSDEGYGVSTGSGVVVSDDGYIVTNNHVIEGSTNIEVTLADKREFEAKVVGKDPSTDIALLKIEASDLESLVFGNSDSLSVGEWVLAVGNPFNLESTVTAGIVSAKGRDINILDDKYRIESFIQTDAAVNPGNSGGALVNTNGELVGINSAIITRSGRYEGYSFAIPSNLVRKIIKDLMDFGTVQRGILGVNIENVTNQLANELKLPNVEGVIITGLTKDGSAIGSGLKEGDIILSIDGVKTKTVPQLQELVARYRPGNKLTIEYFR
ncbi:MAG: trypsin-like peptidase domain-containing protein, partial [Saprospiraceae bacterium]|nr:trypsin-like peptidase domain-containing protein [Saprospiraceae bacterium]